MPSCLVTGVSSGTGAAALAVFHAVVVMFEEPALKQTFDTEYESFRDPCAALDSAVDAMASRMGMADMRVSSPTALRAWEREVERRSGSRPDGRTLTRPAVLRYSPAGPAAWRSRGARTWGGSG